MAIGNIDFILTPTILLLQKIYNGKFKFTINWCDCIFEKKKEKKFNK